MDRELPPLRYHSLRHTLKEVVKLLEVNDILLGFIFSSFAIASFLNLSYNGTVPEEPMTIG